MFVVVVFVVAVVRCRRRRRSPSPFTVVVRRYPRLFAAVIRRCRRRPPSPSSSLSSTASWGARVAAVLGVESNREKADVELGNVAT